MIYDRVFRSVVIHGARSETLTLICMYSIVDNRTKRVLIML